MSTEKKLQELRGSWADIASQAEGLWGERGRAIGLLARCAGMGSKGLLSQQISDAGYDVGKVLEWARQPYSSLGLKEAALELLQAICLELDKEAATQATSTSSS